MIIGDYYVSWQDTARARLCCLRAVTWQGDLLCYQLYGDSQEEYTQNHSIYRYYILNRDCDKYFKIISGE